MNLTNEESIKLTQEIKSKLFDSNASKQNSVNVNETEICLCPSFTALSEVSKLIAGSNIKLGAQNCFSEAKGAFTGEISLSMLKEINCKYIIIGHSERRNLFSETNSLINKKLKAVLASNLQPILCVGESAEARNSGVELNVIEKQLTECFLGINPADFQKIIIAYEPIWAVNSGKPASPEQANEMHKFIKNFIAKNISKIAAEHTQIIYGGSVNSTNISDFLAKENISGCLIGNASLKADEFVKMCKTEIK